MSEMFWCRHCEEEFENEEGVCPECDREGLSNDELDELGCKSDEQIYQMENMR